MEFTYPEIAKMIDHALLAPTLTVDDLDNGCRVASAYDVASVCVMPYYVKRCADILRDTTTAGSNSVLPTTVIGFPHGGQASTTKVAEAEQAIADGAAELDMVVNISSVLSGRWDYVAGEITTIVGIAHEAARKVKVIFENCYLKDSHKKRLCEISCQAGADWVKTSTGFGPRSAAMGDILLMIRCTTSPTEVKAAGGIRDLKTVLMAKEAGVTRIGTSATAAILDAAREQLGLAAINVRESPNTTEY